MAGREGQLFFLGLTLRANPGQAPKFIQLIGVDGCLGQISEVPE